jgi:hypothetical protein
VIWLACVATATGGGIPRKINKGVKTNPPPTPTSPDKKPTNPLNITMSSQFTGISAMGK